MNRALRTFVIGLAGAVMLGSGTAAGQSLYGAGRVFLFGTTQTTKFDDGSTRDFSEVTASIRLQSPATEKDGLEYSFDVRGSAYPGAEARGNRTNVYDAWVAGRTLGGALSLRAGQMWLNELGAIGSVGGVMAEYRSPKTAVGRLRFGAFGGREPKNFQTGYVAGVKKTGGWLAVDGDANRRSVLGYVLLKDSTLTERSILTTTNFIPVGKQFFLYQAAEYDLKGPGGIGKGGLNYIFANARLTPVQPIEIMGTYHHGRSIDTRTITQDILNGRPVDQKSLDGFLFESAGGRITFQITPRFRIYGGYSRDRNNFDDKAAGRITAGLWTSNIARSGFDLTLSDNRFSRPTGKYNALYASLGRSLGQTLYLTADYSTSLSVIRLVDSGGVVVENRPRTRRYGVNGVWNVSRYFSLLGTAEQLQDNNSKSDRILLGLSLRF